MTIQSISSGNVNFRGNLLDNINSKISFSAKEEPKDNKKKLTTTLCFLGVVGLAGLAYSLHKGKGVKLSEINFKNGIAKNKEGENFTGKIKDRLNNGDRIVMEYVDGVLQKSKRSGLHNFEKKYETSFGDKFVETTIGEQTKRTNISSRRRDVARSQIEVERILNNKVKSSDDMYHDFFRVEYKSNNQRQQIYEACRHKEDIEKEVQDRLKREITAQKAQDYYKSLFESQFANKSAKESAEVFIEEHNAAIKKEALARIEKEKQILEAQKYQDSLIEKMQHPSRKSAIESAEAITEREMELAQEKFNKPFEDALSNKSAQESAEVFENAIHREEAGCKRMRIHIDYDERRIPKHVIDRYAENYGFVAVNKTAKIGNETVTIVYEGFATDITSDGRLLQKVFEKNGKIRYEDTQKIRQQIAEAETTSRYSYSHREHESHHERARAYA